MIEKIIASNILTLQREVYTVIPKFIARDYVSSLTGPHRCKQIIKGMYVVSYINSAILGGTLLLFWFVNFHPNFDFPGIDMFQMDTFQLPRATSLVEHPLPTAVNIWSPDLVPVACNIFILRVPCLRMQKGAAKLRWTGGAQRPVLCVKKPKNSGTCSVVPACSAGKTKNYKYQ